MIDLQIINEYLHHQELLQRRSLCHSYQWERILWHCWLLLMKLKYYHVAYYCDYCKIMILGELRVKASKSSLSWHTSEEHCKVRRIVIFWFPRCEYHLAHCERTRSSRSSCWWCEVSAVLCYVASSTSSLGHTTNSKWWSTGATRASPYKKKVNNKVSSLQVRAEDTEILTL